MSACPDPRILLSSLSHALHLVPASRLLDVRLSSCPRMAHSCAQRTPGSSLLKIRAGGFFACVSTVPDRIPLYSGQIFSGSGVDLQTVAGLNKQRNHNYGAGFNGSGLGCAGSCVALEARFCVGYFKFNKQRRLN